jgi:hypothetical protein
MAENRGVGIADLVQKILRVELPQNTLRLISRPEEWNWSQPTSATTGGSVQRSGSPAENFLGRKFRRCVGYD